MVMQMTSSIKEKSLKKSKRQKTLILKEGINFFNLPIIPVIIRPALEARAKELGLLINPYMVHKIKWSEEHGGLCMCDWKNRTCPCDNIPKDLVEYDGQCLCKVLVTNEKMKKIEKNKNKNTTKKTKKTKEQIEKDRARIKEAKELAKKLGCKNY